MVELTEFSLRPATSSDFKAIRSLIHQAGINPLDLNWRRFILAVDPANDILGCGQLKPHSDGSIELASIAVKENYRGVGIGKKIIEYLISTSPTETLYLTCRAGLGGYYEKFGFINLSFEEMPRYFRRVYRVFIFLKKARLLHENLLVMRRSV
jgi:amino-acid N-acetyltransferase